MSDTELAAPPVAATVPVVREASAWRVVLALALPVLDGLVRLLQLQGAAADLAADYLRPVLLLLVFQVVESAGIACLVGAGDTRTGLWVMLGVAVVNLPLAWGFCLGWGPLPKLG